MGKRGLAPAATGLAVGALVAFGFALLIRLLPESLFLRVHWRVALAFAGLLVAGQVMLGRTVPATSLRRS